MIRELPFFSVICVTYYQLMKKTKIFWAIAGTALIASVAILMAIPRQSSKTNVNEIKLPAKTISDTGQNQDTAMASMYLDSANKAYDAKQEDKAKSLYIIAAKLGSADAHFALAYNYNLSRSEKIYHLTESAEKGNTKAMGELLETLIFRANSLTETNPELAYNVYKIAKAKYPSISAYEGEMDLVQKIIEAGPFDGNAFLKKYNITNLDSDNSYYAIWELAEEASRGGRFGKPDPKLVFQIVSRGGFAPAEYESAVNDRYFCWKENKVSPFNICTYVTSQYGMTYCAVRDEKAAEKDYQFTIKKLSSELKNGAGRDLKNAYDMAAKFFEPKALHEEGYGGTMYNMDVIESIIQQKKDYLDLITKIDSGINADTLVKTNEPDKKLNLVFQKLVDKVKNKKENEYMYDLTVKDIRATQRFWISYRDCSAKLFSRIDPAISEEVWGKWMTQTRTQELEGVLELLNE
jgi:uncharacterized protein YecT (DUF1311 family)